MILTEVMKICVVVPNWNGADMIEACLNSLETQSTKAEIVVVENGSSDNSAEVIKKKFPNITLLEFDDNAGFAGGVNRGINYAIKNNADYVALFNNDAVAEKNWLKKLTKEIEKDSKYGIVTGKFLRSDKKHIDSTGDYYSIWGIPFPRGRNQKDNGQYEKAEDVFAATGGASLYRTALFKDIGLFDEDFFAYCEDVDISLRTQMAGWKIRYTPDAVAYHEVGGTSEKLGDFGRYHSAKNYILLYTRNMPGWLFIKYLPLFLYRSIFRMSIAALVKGKFKAFISGTWAAVKLSGSTIKVRKQNLSKQKISNKQLDSILYHSKPPKIPIL